MRETYLRIGPITAFVRAPRHALDEFLGHAQVCAVPETNPDLVLELRAIEDRLTVPPEGSTRSARELPSGLKSYRFCGPEFEVGLILGRPARAGGVFTSPEFIVERSLRRCVSVMLPLRGALLLHASAVSIDGQACVFTGVSGVGKSTIAKLLADVPGVRSMGDELVITEVDAHGARVHSTPFGGELPRVPPTQAPLRCIYFLEPPPGPPTSRSARVALLLRNTLSDARDTRVAEALLANAQVLLERAECRGLYRPSRTELLAALAG
jgi:hypothetical protein